MVKSHWEIMIKNNPKIIKPYLQANPVEHNK
jgi:hypothetical protein